ncbi:sigma factor-like helix-turn-helix DNA-binding protein [Actinomycetospora sp. CA-084318]|uniref:sigma factor-like helix-turn-helix DNA-binding protein n=1 Tax=Actinomycetospora sp. CA-084318 TaxID=3239892 RepID=UPI003D98ED69
MQEHHRTPRRTETDDQLDALVGRAVAGDRAALGAVLAAIRPVVVRSCRAHLGPGATDTDDVAREVCLAVLRALPVHRGRGQPFLAFVSRVVADELAARPADGPGAVRALAALPAREREVLRLRVVLGLSAEETAAALGSTPSAVRVVQHRALTALRRTDPAASGDSVLADLADG